MTVTGRKAPGAHLHLSVQSIAQHDAVWPSGKASGSYPEDPGSIPGTATGPVRRAETSFHRFLRPCVVSPRTYSSSPT